MIPVITWTFCLIYLEIGSLFPGNVPVGFSGCRPLSYFRIFYGSRSIVEYMPILYYRRLSELFRCFRISIHYSDPPLGVRSNTPLQACACMRTCKVSWLSVGFRWRLFSYIHGHTVKNPLREKRYMTHGFRVAPIQMSVPVRRAPQRVCSIFSIGFSPCWDAHLVRSSSSDESLSLFVEGSERGTRGGAACCC